MFQRIATRNFKSFADLDVEMRPLTVLVGPNASGKTNFLKFVEFVGALPSGAQEAMDNLGGAHEVMRWNRQPASLLSFSFDRRIDAGFLAIDTPTPITCAAKAVRYRATIGVSEALPGFTIYSDEIEIEGEFARLERNGSAESWVAVEARPGKLGIALSGAGPRILVCSDNRVDQKILNARLEAHHAQGLSRGAATGTSLILEETREFLSPGMYAALAGSSGHPYSFDPYSLKRPARRTLAHDIWENGGNLAGFLRHVLSSPEACRDFRYLLREILPLVRDVSTADIELTNDAIITVNEVFHPERHIRAGQISDGTVTAIALVSALFFSPRDVIMIEEPERGIDPAQIAALAGLLIEASKARQVIVTTHSPELVRHIPREYILMASRDSGGNTILTRPDNSQEIHHYFEHDLNVADLMVQGTTP